jgi:formiminoglutamate deiminase
LTDDETKRLAASGAVAGLCPITEANLGDGIFPAAEYLAARGAFGLGTDSNVLIDAAGELRSLEYAQRLKRRARNVLAPEAGRSTGRAMYDGALRGGARALGSRISGLQTGASADFISLDAADPSFSARTGDALLDSWIFAGGSIDCVWRHGRKIVSQGRHRQGAIVRERYLRVITRLVR